EARGDDGAVWLDDAVELFLEPAPGGPYFHFIVNAAGDVLDEEGRDRSWSSGRVAAVRTDEDGWAVELLVPWEDLGGRPDAGDTWRLNVCRDMPHQGRSLTWAPLESSFHEPESFGELRFSSEPPPCAPLSVHRTADHVLIIDARAGEGAHVSAALRQDGADVTVADTDRDAELRLAIPQPGSFLLRLEATAADGSMTFRQEVPVMRRAPMELSLQKRLLTGREVTLEMDCEALAVAPERYRMTVAGLEPVELQADAEHPKMAQITVDISELEPGEVSVHAEALRGAEIVARADTTFELPPRPEWVGSDVGVSDALPEPWTPVRTSADGVSCWGREHRFGEQPLLSELTTAGEQVLAAPMRLVSVVGGRHQVWEDVSLQWTDRSDAAATGVITAGSDLATLRLDLRCEFDGMMRFDLSLTPQAGEALQEVLLEIPLRAEHAKYLHLANASWGGSVSTALPGEGWEHRFMPFVWLGDEERGVQWFAESDEGWRPRDPDAVITVDRREGVATLRLHMVEEPLAAGAEFRTTFGLQATPVKPLDPDHRRWHITHGAFYGIEDQPASAVAYLAYPAEGNILLERGTVEMWVKPLFDPQVEVEEATRGRFNRELLRLELDNGDTLGFYWNIDDRCMRLYTRVDDEVKLVVTSEAPEPWRQGQWHHVAFTWGEQATIDIDGQAVASREWQGSLPGTLQGARLILGSAAAHSPCEFAVDELRISDRPLDLAGEPPADIEPDERTLLHDGFDSPASEAADVAATPGREMHGREQITWVEGVAGGAVAIGAPDARLSLLDDLKRRGVNTLVFHQEWTEIQAYGTTQMHREKLHSLVEACHERDIRLLLYFGYELSDAAPEWDLYRDEVLVRPRRGGYQRRDIPQTAYICCYKSPWKEYILTSIARMIEEFDIDGVYLDGTTEPFACANELHGCGYVGPDGERHPTYPIFEVRDLMRRMRQIIRSRKPEGLISAHMSATVSIPTLAFVDTYWDGEQLDVHEHGFRLPLDAFRAEFMGHNWGVPAEFLCYQNRPFTVEEALALALLHDVPVRPYARSEILEMMANVWDAWEAIEINAAEWFPYWQEDSPVAADDPDLLISTHVGPGGALIVATNASGETASARLTIDRARVDLGEAVTATDLIAERELDFDAGALSVEIDPWEAAIVLLRPAE
ncbi:MAG: glycoside hydrolase domain-containing protein, partial [Armatimonadota bacterium]